MAIVLYYCGSKGPIYLLIYRVIIGLLRVVIEKKRIPFNIDLNLAFPLLFMFGFFDV